MSDFYRDAVFVLALAESGNDAGCCFNIFIRRLAIDQCQRSAAARCFYMGEILAIAAEEFVFAFLTTDNQFVVRFWPNVAAYLTAMEERFCDALANDLNMSRALGAVFDFMKKINPILANGQLDLEQKKYILETLEKLNGILNLLKLKECPLAPEIDRLIKAREEARRNKDWQRADTVRNELAEKGFEIVDTPKGPVWKEIEKAEQ